jgi:hypothetical protein
MASVTVCANASFPIWLGYLINWANPHIRPINTYNGRGLSKPGFSREDRRAHAVIYMSGTTPWLAGNELDVVKQPIAVDKSSEDQVLDKYSRLNFARIHSVDFNTKVMDVGFVAKNSLAYLDGYYHEHR